MNYPDPMNSRFRKTSIFHSRKSLVALTAFALLALATTTALTAGFTGAIYTTNGGCTGVNVNIFDSKAAVYLDGGPQGGGSGLATGYYYVKVTEPDGTLLGTSVGSGNPTPIGVGHVNAGKFDTCYQLASIVQKASDQTLGYDDTTNGGGEYKVWVSPDAGFVQQKTDNFKVKPDEIIQQGTLNVIKFYDANANGANDDGQLIAGWKVRIQDGIDLIRFTPAMVIVEADDYVVSEFAPAQTNWVSTTTNPVNTSVAANQTVTVAFGNLCLGAGGGKTHGFWSNKNGEATMNDGGGAASELTLLSSLCLRNANGTDFNPATYASFRTWILGANATNMANMLSAQLAAMQLNVEAGLVGSGALIYAPGTTSANGLGFATVGAVMAEANASLCANPSVFSGNPERAHQEALKNALDNANNNLTFVQGTPCPFTFAE